MKDKASIIQILQEGNYFFDEYTHEEIYTVKESLELKNNFPGANTKNLFLKNKKKEFLLISCLQSTKIDLKEFSKKNNFGNLSFTNSEYLMDLMHVKPGSVSPFALLNNKNNSINFYLDTLITKSKLVNFHPLVNSSTIAMNTEDFIDLMVANNKIVNIYDFMNNICIKTIK